MITLPSCDMRSPAPIPKKTSDTAKAVPFRVTSIVATSTSEAIAIAPRPTWTTARGPNRTATFGPRSAAASIEIDIGKSRLPVSNASKPSTTWRYTGRTKNVPITISCCAESEVSPPRSVSIFSSARLRSVLRPSRSRRSSQARKQPRTTKPPRIRNGTRENPERRDLVAIDRRRVDRLDPTPGAALQDPEHDQSERGRRERSAAVVQLRRLLRLGRALHAPVDDEHRDHHDDLADEDVPPTPGRRHVAADQRAGRNRRTCGAADHPVGERAILTLVVRGGQRGDRRDHQHRAEPLDPRPADQQHRQVRAERCDQRAQPVHGQAKSEGPVATEDVAELRADEHERRHHERVHRDRALHAQ